MTPLDVKRVAKLGVAAPNAARILPADRPEDLCPVRSIATSPPLDETDIEHLVTIASVVMAPRGRTLFSEAEPAQSLYSILQGTIRLLKLMPDGRRQITGFLYPGDFVGLADNDAYAYGAEAVTDCTLLRYPMDPLCALIHRYPELEHKLCMIARHELAEAQDQMLLLGRKTARERVASFLLGSAARAARHGRDSDRVSLPMTRGDIADYLGMATETASRIFVEFRGAGLISDEQSHELALLDRPALEQIAEGLD